MMGETLDMVFLIYSTRLAYWRFIRRIWWLEVVSEYVMDGSGLGFARLPVLQRG